MPYNTLTGNSKTFNETQLGTYVLSTVLFGDPQNYIKLRPGKVRNDGLIAVGATRVMEKDVLVNGTDETRVSCIQTTNFLVYPEGFTTSEIISLQTDTAAILTAARIGEMLMGRY
jgi:hypothetical protein